MDQSSREELRRRYLAVDTSNVCDVLDDLGHTEQGLHSSFRPMSNGDGEPRLAGWAYTIRGQMTPFPMGGDSDKMQACEGLTDGEISVWSGDGEGICYFGELIALGMQERGCAGALVDGGIRDCRWLRHHGFPVFARYRTSVQSIGRWKVNGRQTPVALRGATAKFVRVDPGDFVLGDEDGVVVVPAALAERVLVEAERLGRLEADIRSELASGLGLDDALKKYGHV